MALSTSYVKSGALNILSTLKYLADWFSTLTILAVFLAPKSISNEERRAALAVENELLLAVVETNKWQHVIQDRRLALRRITHEVEGQAEGHAIGIQQSGNVLEGLLSGIRWLRNGLDSNAASYLNPKLSSRTNSDCSQVSKPSASLSLPNYSVWTKPNMTSYADSSDAAEDNESLLTMGSYPKARTGSRRLSTWKKSKIKGRLHSIAWGSWQL